MTIIAETRELTEPLLFREKLSDPPGKTSVSPSDSTEESAEKGVLCQSCRAVLTSLNKAISVNNQHLHTFFNPAGIVYEIRCFSEAPGCLSHGKPTDEFTWFKGYTWEYALCANCLDHLGWFYNSGNSSFYGLINGKLIVDEEPT